MLIKCAQKLYRFAFNGQTRDDEVYGVTGSLNTALFWEYDTRLGRRWNVDPVVKEEESPYACFNGNPIQKTDVNGDDPATGAAIAIATQEVAAALVATGVLAPLAPVVETVGLIWSLIETMESIPTRVPDVNKAPEKPKIEVKKAKAKTKEEIDYGTSGKEHTANKRPSTKSKHQEGQARKKQDRGGEKGDTKRRYPNKRPPNWKGTWPPK